MGWFSLSNFLKNINIFDRIGSTIVVKSGQLSDSADTFMLAFSADTLDFAVAI